MFRGEKITKLRKEKHLTQRELAKKIGVSAAALSQWENDTVVPSFLNMECLAEALGVSLDTVAGDNDYVLKKTIFRYEGLKEDVTKYIETNCPGAMPALDYMLRTRSASKRADRETPYAYHPLIMVRQAMALGIADEKLVVFCLLHDAYEVSHTAELDELYPAEYSNLLRKLDKGQDKANRRIYFERVAADEYLAMVKILSRCSNLTSMTGGIPKSGMDKRIRETERYYPELFEAAARKEEWKEAVWQLEYQIVSLIEIVKWHH